MMAMALHTHELAEYLRVHLSTIYPCSDRYVRALRVGSDWRFSREAIDRWRVAQLEPTLSRAVLRHRFPSSLLHAGGSGAGGVATTSHRPEGMSDQSCLARVFFNR
jgi:excisionase family DNA binding protein